MRKFLVIASILMISAAAHAAPLVQMAANDTPQAQPATDSTAAPAAAPALAAEPAKTPDAKTPDAKAADAKPVETKKPRQHVRARESDEHKARRIAAKYGVYW